MYVATASELDIELSFVLYLAFFPSNRMRMYASHQLVSIAICTHLHITAFRIVQ